MNLLNVGSQSRKTGIFASSKTKRDQNNLEDLNDFFEKNGNQNESDDLSEPTARKSKTSNRRSTTTYKRRRLSKAPLEKPDEVSTDASDGVEFNDNDMLGSPIHSDVEEERYEQEVPTASPARMHSRRTSTRITKAGRSPVQTPATPKSKKTPQRRRPADDQVIEIEEPVKGRQKTKPKPKPIAKASVTKASIAKTSAAKKPQKKLTSAPEINGRPKRTRIPPVAFWKNEKIVYEYGKQNHVPSIKEVITVDDSTEPLSTKRKATARKKKPTSNVGNKGSSKSSDNIQYVYVNKSEKLDDKSYPNADWMKEGTKTIKIYEAPGTKTMKQRQVAWATDCEKYTQKVVSKKDNFKLAILFSEEQEFAASGMLEFPVGGTKHTKNTEDTYFIFYVVRGIIDVTISGSTFTVNTGCSFEIPMGNFYQFENKGETPAKMFFVQSKYVLVGDDDDDDEDNDVDDETDE